MVDIPSDQHVMKAGDVIFSDDTDGDIVFVLIFKYGTIMLLMQLFHSQDVFDPAAVAI